MGVCRSCHDDCHDSYMCKYKYFDLISETIKDFHSFLCDPISKSISVFM
jgi:hypothetical protein